MTTLRPVTDVVYRPAAAGVSAAAFDVLPGSGAEEAGPALIHLHGGGWRAGDKAGNVLAAGIAAAGLTVVNANYALTTEAPYPRNVEDVFALLAFLAERGEEFGIDPRRLILSGSSAGAHLSSLAVTKGLAEDRLAVVPRGVISWFSPLDPVSRYLRHRYPAQHYPGSFWDRGSSRSRDERDVFRPLIGTDDFSAVTLRDALDPDPRFHLDRFDTAALPPFLLFAGTRDSEEIRSSQSIWHAALRSVGADVELLWAQDVDHEGAGFRSPATLGAALGFARHHTLSVPAPV